MKIWILRLDVNKYPWISFEERSNLLKKTEIFNGNRLSDGWQPVKLKKVSTGAAGANALGGDIPPLIDKKVIAAIQDLLSDAVEILPVEYIGDDYPCDNFYILNVIERLNCFDYEKSVFKRFESGRIMMVVKHSFLKEAVAGKHIFLAKDGGSSKVFISDEFKTRLEEHGLKGFRFELAWDSEDENAAEGAAQEERTKRNERFQHYLDMKKGKIASLKDDEVVAAAMTWMQGKITKDHESVYDAIVQLTEICQTVFAMYAVKWDVDNGGFIQFYDNYGLEIGLLAARGYAEIGLNDLSEIITKANEIVKNNPKAYIGEMDDEEEDMDADMQDPLDALDHPFCDNPLLDRLDALCIELIRQNAEVFGD